MSTVTPRTTPGSRAATAVTAIRALAALATLNVLYQAATAGAILMPDSESAQEWHGGGAIVLHVLTGLLTLATFWYRRTAGGPWWPTVVSAVVFVASFVVAWFGEGESLWIHVPSAMALAIGTVWVTAWSFLPALSSRR